MAGRTPKERYQQAPPRAGKYVSALVDNAVTDLSPALELSPAALSAAGRLFVLRDSAELGENETKTYAIACDAEALAGGTFGVLSYSFAAEGGAWSLTTQLGADVEGGDELDLLPTRVGAQIPEAFTAVANPTLTGGEEWPPLKVYSAAVQPRIVGVTGQTDVPVLFFPNDNDSDVTPSIVLTVENLGGQAREYTIEVLVIRACRGEAE